MEEEKIYIKDFPPFIKFRVDKGFLDEIFKRSLESAGDVELETPSHKFWLFVEKQFDKPKYEFIFGEGKGAVISSLLNGPSTSKEVLEKNRHLSPSTIHHSIGKLKKLGIIAKLDEGLSLKEDVSKKVIISYLAKVKDELERGKRRKLGISKKEIELAIYLWKKYEDVCRGENLDINSRKYSQTYLNIFHLAATIHRWKNGKSDIPKWALVGIAGLARMEHVLNEEGVIVDYHLPPGIRIRPYYGSEYKIPIKADLNLDRLVIRLLAKSTGDGKNYSYRDREKLFKELQGCFGFFQSRGIPSAIREIIKRHYKIDSFDRDRIKIPETIKERWKKFSERKEILHKISILETVFEMAGRSNGQYELRFRSKEFLKEVSDLLEDVGLRRLNIQKRKDRPHYRSWISRKKAGTIYLYKEPEKIYPDFLIWDRIPLNKIRKRIREKAVLKDAKKRVEESCREELYDYVTSILKSVGKSEGFPPHIVRNKFTKYRDEIAGHFWQVKKVPAYRDVFEYQNNLVINRVNLEKLLYPRIETEV